MAHVANCSCLGDNFKMTVEFCCIIIHHYECLEVANMDCPGGWQHGRAPSVT